MIEEIWKDIRNYEGLYQVSNLGKVKSLRKNIILKGGLVGNMQKYKTMEGNSIFHNWNLESKGE